MQNELINQGLSLMALGMGVVFVFLALLVVTTYSMSALVSRYFPEVIQASESFPEDTSDSSGELPDAKTMAVIQQAILKHRKGLSNKT